MGSCADAPIDRIACRLLNQTLRPATPAMEDAEDLDCLVAEPICHDKWLQDQFT